MALSNLYHLGFHSFRGVSISFYDNYSYLPVLVIYAAFRPKRFLLISLLLGSILLIYYSEAIERKYCVASDCVGSALYLRDKLLKQLGLGFRDEAPQWDGRTGDKIIVMAHTALEDITWVEKYLPE
jgi:hypothetical protein